MKTKRELLSISERSDPSKTLWSDFLIFRNSKSEVAVNRAAGDFPQHLHEFAELSFFSSGQARHRIGNFEHAVQEGCFAVAVPGDRHCYFDASKDFKRINVQVRSRYFSELIETLSESGLDLSVYKGGYPELAHKMDAAEMLSPAQFSECLRIVLTMEEEWLSAESGFAAALKFKLGELLILLARSLHAKGVKLPEAAKRPLFDAIDLIDRDYARAVSLEELEEVAKMGRRTLERAFKAETGLSPKGYILKTRIAWACRLLANSGMRIQEAASACGFKDQNYFTRIFKTTMGVTPGRFLADCAKKRRN